MGLPSPDAEVITPAVPTTTREPRELESPQPHGLLHSTQPNPTWPSPTKCTDRPEDCSGHRLEGRDTGYTVKTTPQFSSKGTSTVSQPSPCTIQPPTSLPLSNTHIHISPYPPFQHTAISLYLPPPRKHRSPLKKKTVSIEHIYAAEKITLRHRFRRVNFVDVQPQCACRETCT